VAQLFDKIKTKTFHEAQYIVNNFLSRFDNGLYRIKVMKTASGEQLKAHPAKIYSYVEKLRTVGQKSVSKTHKDNFFYLTFNYMRTVGELGRRRSLVAPVVSVARVPTSALAPAPQVNCPCEVVVCDSVRKPKALEVEVCESSSRNLALKTTTKANIETTPQAVQGISPEALSTEKAAKCMAPKNLLDEFDATVDHSPSCRPSIVRIAFARANSDQPTDAAKVNSWQKRFFFKK